jgi:hypothetical protein
VSRLVILVTILVSAASPGPFGVHRDSPPPPRTRLAAPGRIDEIVLARLKQLDLQPAPLASDAVFLRRVHLDVIGTLPTVAATRAFLDSKDPGKRDALIDDLLQRDEFADYWAMKWSDLLRVKSEYPINLWPNAVQAYHHWIRASIAANMPYDQFARELLTESGSNFRVPPVNFYRAVRSREPAALASAVALTFMGVRAERWPAARLNGMAVFFSRVGYKSTQEWKEEIVHFDRTRAEPSPVEATFPDGRTVVLSGDQDPRQAFADWLVTPDNPWFTRAIANRVWSWLLGRGVVHEPDDLRPDNPPSHPDLLAYLERELAGAHYDVKHLFRLILRSETYQRSSAGAGGRSQPDASFARYIARPIEAEVLIDAIDQVTGTSEQYSSQIPEPFTFIPATERTIALADGSITSPFLKTFGRSPRDLGLESERNSTTTATERLALLNSSQIQQKLEQSPALRAVLQSSLGPRQLVGWLYLAVLSRAPTEDELKAVLAYAESAKLDRRAIVMDVAWSLINTAEFLYRH